MRRVWSVVAVASRGVVLLAVVQERLDLTGARYGLPGGWPPWTRPPVHC
jgi:hypothetical protein